MHTFFDFTLNENNNKIFHLFTGSVLGNFKELKNELNEGWSIYTYFPDTLTGVLLPQSSSENLNQPVSSYTLILVKNPEIKQKLILFRKFGKGDVDYSNFKEEIEFLDFKTQHPEDEFQELLSQNFSLVGNINNENSNQQHGWLTCFVQIFVMQKSNIKKTNNLKILND